MTSSPSSAGGPGFAGHVVSFAGKLASIGRREAQALIQALGGEPSDDVTSRTTMLVVGDSAAREDDSSKLRRAEQVNAKAPEQIRIISESEFCRLAGIASGDALRRQVYGVRDIRSLYPRITENYLRYLEKWGLIRPAATTRTERFYTFTDLATIKQLASELDRDVPLKTALRSLHGRAPGAARARLSRVGQRAGQGRRAAVTSAASARPTAPAYPAVRQRLAVSRSAGRARRQVLRRRLAARRWRRSGMAEAAAAYRKALVIDPTWCRRSSTSPTSTTRATS